MHPQASLVDGKAHFVGWVVFNTQGGFLGGQSSPMTFTQSAAAPQRTPPTGLTFTPGAVSYVMKLLYYYKMYNLLDAGPLAPWLRERCIVHHVPYDSASCSPLLRCEVLVKLLQMGLELEKRYIT